MRQHWHLQFLLEVVAQKASAGLLDCHGFGDFAPEELESGLGIEAERGTLDVGGADDHAGEAEFAGHGFGRAQHTLSQAAAAPGSIDVHAAELRRVAVATLDAERSHDLRACASRLDHPEGIASCPRKYIGEMRKLSFDRARDVLLEQRFHPRRGQLSVYPRPKVSHRLEIERRVRSKFSLWIAHLAYLPRRSRLVKW